MRVSPVACDRTMGRFPLLVPSQATKPTRTVICYRYTRRLEPCRSSWTRPAASPHFPYQGLFLQRDARRGWYWLIGGCGESSDTTFSTPQWPIPANLSLISSSRADLLPVLMRPVLPVIWGFQRSPDLQCPTPTEHALRIQASIVPSLGYEPIRKGGPAPSQTVPDNGENACGEAPVPLCR